MPSAPELHMLPIAELRPAGYNPRVISKRELAKLRAGIRRFGLVEPLVVRRRDRLVLGGHQRLRAAAAEGLAEVPCMLVDCTDDEAKLLNLALNKVSGTWDVPALSELLADLTARGAGLELSGFEPDEVDRLLGTLRDEELRGPSDSLRDAPTESPPNVPPNAPRRFPDVKCPRCGECFAAF